MAQIDSQKRINIVFFFSIGLPEAVSEEIIINIIINRAPQDQKISS